MSNYELLLSIARNDSELILIEHDLCVYVISANPQKEYHMNMLLKLYEE